MKSKGQTRQITQNGYNKIGLRFEDALKFVEPRPWLVDDLEEWKDRMRQTNPHKCAAIFIDNSGFDVVLGIIPFVEELLRFVYFIGDFTPEFSYRLLNSSRGRRLEKILVKKFL